MEDTAPGVHSTAGLQFIHQMFQQESAIFWQNILISTAEWLQR